MWSYYKNTTYSKLRVAFNNVYRRELRYTRISSARPMYTTHNINNMEALLRRSIYSFIERLMDSSNMIINTVMNPWYIRFNILDFWNSKLYLWISSYIESLYAFPLSRCQIFSLFIFTLK